MNAINRLALVVFFVAAGIMHFIRPGTYLKIMPPSVPFPMAMIYISGALEVLLGLFVLPEKTRKIAGWGLSVLLIAVFPANLHMVLHPEIFPNMPVWALWARLPLQGVLIFWVWKVTNGVRQTS